MTGATELDEAAQPGPPGVVRSSDGLGGKPEPMRTTAEKRAYSRGYAAGKKAEGSADKVAELSALVDVVRARNSRLEEELAQARASRDLSRQKYEQVSAWMRAHIRIAPDGAVLLARPETPNDSLNGGR